MKKCGVWRNGVKSCNHTFGHSPLAIPPISYLIGLLTLAAKRRGWSGMVVVMSSMTNSSRARSEEFDVANHVVRGQYIVEQHERS